MNSIRYNCPGKPYAQVYKKVSLTISPFNRENKVMTEELVSSNLLYFQKIVWPKKTKPRKNGITPNRNTNKLLHDLDKVDDIKFKLGLYSKYLRIVTHASITPKPIRSYLCSNMAKCYSIVYSRSATNAPNI